MNSQHGEGPTYHERPVTINYPGSNNFSSFTYDGDGNRVKIVETTSGSVSSTKQFIFDSGMSEARDAGGTTVLSQFFQGGETIAGSNYYYTLDHLGSVRELTDGGGNIQSEYAFDPWGNLTSTKS
jgi:uncharacterized protein RhaS with RHS repeats